MACNSLKIYNNELFVDWKITCFWWQTCFYWVLEMIPPWLLPVFILILHPQCSLFRAEGGCPRNENGQQQNWRYAVYERKEKGLPKHKEIWKLMNIENMSWENHRPILPSFKYNFSDLILPTIRTVQLPWSWLLVYHDEFILTWWIYFDMMMPIMGDGFCTPLKIYYTWHVCRWIFKSQFWKRALFHIKDIIFIEL